MKKYINRIFSLVLIMMFLIVPSFAVGTGTDAINNELENESYVAVLKADDVEPDTAKINSGNTTLSPEHDNSNFLVISAVGGLVVVGAVVFIVVYKSRKQS